MTEIIHADNDPIVEQWRQAIATLERVEERCQQMRLWGDAGRYAATFILNAMDEED